MSTEFASASYTAGQLNAVVKLIRAQAGEDGVERFLRGELTVLEPTRSWHEEGGVIYFSVTSDGTTGSQWIERLENQGVQVGDYAKQVLPSSDFKPTSGVTTNIAVLKGMLFKSKDRVVKKIRAEADRRKLEKPNPEVACLIREKFTGKEIRAMGLQWIVAMHEPIADSNGDLNLLGAGDYGSGARLLAFYQPRADELDYDGGFAFAALRVSS